MMGFSVIYYEIMMEISSSSFQQKNIIGLLNLSLTQIHFDIMSFYQKVRIERKWKKNPIFYCNPKGIITEMLI